MCCSACQKMKGRGYDAPLPAGGGTWMQRKSGVHTKFWIQWCPAGRTEGSVRLVPLSFFFLKISPLCFVKFCVRWPLCLCAGTLRTLHRLLKTQNTLQIQSITRSECAGRSNPAPYSQGVINGTSRSLKTSWLRFSWLADFKRREQQIPAFFFLISNLWTNRRNKSWAWITFHIFSDGCK